MIAGSEQHRSAARRARGIGVQIDHAARGMIGERLEREQKSLRGPRGAATWRQIVSALEQAKGESWSSFVNRHGDWGRDAALWLGRRAGRLKLGELGSLAGGLDYAVVSKAIARFGHRLDSEVWLCQQLTSIQNQLSK